MLAAPADVGSTLPWPRTWSLAAFAARALDQRLPVLAARLPDLATPIRRFLELIATVEHRGTVVVHGDLVAEHILLDEGAGMLAGIIDFGDLALGDPAQDLLVAWSYGEAAAARIVRRYDPLGSDPGLLERSRCHFLRYRIDRLFDRLCEGTDEAVIGWEAAELGGHLARFAAQH